MFDDMKSLKDIFVIDIYSGLKPCITPDATLDPIIKKIIVDYTGSSYLNINKALTSTNPWL